MYNSNTWNHLTESKQISSGLFKSVTSELLVYKSYIYIFTYKQDLALNSL